MNKKEKYNSMNIKHNKHYHKDNQWRSFLQNLDAISQNKRSGRDTRQ